MVRPFRRKGIAPTSVVFRRKPSRGFGFRRQYSDWLRLSGWLGAGVRRRERGSMRYDCTHARCLFAPVTGVIHPIREAL